MGDIYRIIRLCLSHPYKNNSVMAADVAFLEGQFDILNSEMVLYISTPAYPSL